MNRPHLNQEHNHNTMSQSRHRHHKTLSWCLLSPAKPMTTSTTRSTQGKRRRTDCVPAHSSECLWPAFFGCAMHCSLGYRSSGRLDRDLTTYGSDASPDTYSSLNRLSVVAGCGRPPPVLLRLSRAATSSSVPKYFETRVRYASQPRSTGTQSIKGMRNQQYARDTAPALRELSI
jgi:hypothetical protein